MMLNIGHIAKTYGILPSHVLDNATTYDLMIADVMSTWEEHQYNKTSGKPVVPKLSKDQLLTIFNKGKEKE
jgi:hypothetical protein